MALSPEEEVPPRRRRPESRPERLPELFAQLVKLIIALSLFALGVLACYLLQTCVGL